jgi:predicted Co/Zn/Cd cation transporter (cation efflux family)
MMIQKKIEKGSLAVSAVVNLIMAIAGFWVFGATRIQALFLDGFFSFIGFASVIFAVIISAVSNKRTRAYPDGLYFLEPLYAILKSLLTLTLLVVSVISTTSTAYAYFAHGIGKPMNIGPVLPYTICMVVLCFGLFFYNRLQNRKINNTSTILAAESKSNYVDGILSLGVGVAIVLMDFVDINGSFGFLHYTGDFFITTILVLISLKPPIIVLLHSFKELSNGVANDEEIKKHILKIVDTHLDGIIPNMKCDIFKIGMHIKIRILLPSDLTQDAICRFTETRQSILEELKMTYDSVELNFVF